ncbi:EcoRII N-terminal effector-binding domain-containing protein [Arthrobacter dokdonensis]|uniref:EcoRII N-terminal effector-binding domain-containing protein n=1 Tax=Arthrobacter dokdonellae TaxID=2211210 RepID=UPI001494EDAE|nr:EcoRII N-terminal effector-binding domain-containing protein [Arthrobacter dokdonellae]
MSEREESVTKVLTANDLGLTGSHQAGIVVPKNEVMLNFFPSLDSNLINPRTTLSAIDFHTRELISLPYIYYNGNLHGTSTRNEYRITGLTAFFRVYGAAPGDEIHFTRTSSPSYVIQIQRPDPRGFDENAPEKTSKISLSGKWSTYKRIAK